MGTPQELTDEQGNVVWLGYDYAWGGRYTHHYTSQSLNDCAIIESDLQPIRFQGQFYDVETSLHYNRFRYYDSDVGMFIQRDPIGLLGGVNVFQYADNPVQFIDPFGLCTEPVSFGKNWNEKRKKHFQQMRQEAPNLGIEMPKKFKDDATEQVQKDMVQKIISEGEIKNQKYMTIENANWHKIGDSIVITKDNEFVTYLRHSQGGAASGWEGGHR